jgi:hypothetical protein
LEDFENANATFQPLIDNGCKHPLVVYGYGLYLLGVNKQDLACKWLQRFLDNPGTDFEGYVLQAQMIMDDFCSNTDKTCY